MVVATHRRRALLAAVLDEVLAATAPAEVVVVDDGSGDGTAELLAERAAAEPRLRPLVTANAGPMAARLAGARFATGDVVLLLDDDVVPARGVVDGHARHHAQAGDLVVIGSMPVAPGPVTRTSYPRDIYARTYRAHTEFWQSDPGRILRTLWSGHLSLRRDAFLALEDALLGVDLGYHEDLELGLLCERAGLRGCFDPSLTSRHLYERTREQFLRDGARSGRGLREVHRRHADLLGPMPEDGFTSDLPAPAAWLVRRSARARWPCVVADVLVAVAGALRLWRVQRFAAGAVRWRMEQHRGAVLEEDAAPERPAAHAASPAVPRTTADEAGSPS